MAGEIEVLHLLAGSAPLKKIGFLLSDANYPAFS
jgi:hypothetical protein